MAMLASKQGVSAMPAQLQPTRDYTNVPGSRRTPLSDTSNRDQFASPTESEFSEAYDTHDSVKSWDEKQVGDWLRSIGCGAYAQTFKDNNVNGSNLIECDQAVLKEMGIKKIGDRVRIFVGIKGLRSKSGSNQKKRNRESMANLDKYGSLDTPSSISPHGTNYRLRERSTGGSKRFSTQLPNINGPLTGYPHPSPKDNGRNGPAGYFSQPQSAKTATGRRPETPQNAQSSTKLPVGTMRVIWNQQTKMLVVKDLKSYDEIMGNALKKMNGRGEQHTRNYCFWVLDPTAEEPGRCRRLSDKEVVKTCQEANSLLRGRLILKAIHAGEPNSDEIERSRALLAEDIRYDYQSSFAKTSVRNLDKAARMLGEAPEQLSEPHSPAVRDITPLTDTRRPTLPPTRLHSVRPAQPTPLAQQEFSPPKRTDSKAKKPLDKFMGARPPSEFINYDLTSYFPDHDSKAIERTVSMAQRRSARMSKALSRLSTASNFSVKEAMKDAPAMPSIPQAFLSQDPFANAGGIEAKAARPLSVWRQSVASSMLQPLREEDDSIDNEPDRKSYVSFGDSASELSASLGKGGSSITDTDSSATAFYDDGSNGTNSHTLHDQCREALAADGEGPDEELDAFLTGNTFDKFSWMQGALIGQGSFASVYLALHAVTGELMAVKQVELPGRNGADPALDKRKESMLAALKREINLLSDLQHENIVQYLGVQATEENLNIFLEYVPGGSVASMLNNYGHLQEPLIKNFVRQILSGLSYLHKRDIIHRDIKGANILVDNKGKVKISDFGISKKNELSSASGKDAAGGAAGNKRVSMQGSVFWMAPEVVRQTSYTRKADIWSMGCLVVEMFTGEHPFPKMNQMQAIFQIGGSKKPDIPEIASQDAKDFLNTTFEIDENKRPEAEELQQMAFLKV